MDAADCGKRRMKSQVLLFVGDALGNYGCPDGHPFSVDRQGAFWKEALTQGLDKRVTLAAPRLASREELLRFHDEKHLAPTVWRVIRWRISPCRRRRTHMRRRRSWSSPS